MLKFKFRFNRKRLLVYALKLAKQSGTPECVAKGVALGLFIGLLVPMGGQILIVLPLAFWLKANKITACAFTMVTNHFTVLFLYPFQCVLGSYIIASPLTYKRVEQLFIDFFKSPSWHELILMGDEIIIPFFVGGALLAVTSSVIGYFTSLRLVRTLRNRKAKRKLATEPLANHCNEL
ncbi:MAG: DUF2062 domain-containing protein [Victivallales bacterium]|nr:DUF2062 domain-containing protein [Victivallales bacterium]